jgi:hypothetical protein
MKRRWIWIAPLAVIGMIAFIALGGEIVRSLWNWLLPPLFGWRQITFWQAVALLALCRILFGRIGGRGFRGPGYRWRRERWEKMTPEEREKFRERMRSRCGRDETATANPTA